MGQVLHGSATTISDRLLPHRHCRGAAEGKLFLYVAIDRTSKFAFVQVVRKTGEPRRQHSSRP